MATLTNQEIEQLKQQLKEKQEEFSLGFIRGGLSLVE